MLTNYYSKLIIEPLEHEIKNIKKRLNKKINLTRELDKKNLSILERKLNEYYKKYYELLNKH